MISPKSVTATIRFRTPHERSACSSLAKSRGASQAPGSIQADNAAAAGSAGVAATDLLGEDIKQSLQALSTVAYSALGTLCDSKAHIPERRLRSRQLSLKGSTEQSKIRHHWC